MSDEEIRRAIKAIKITKPHAFHEIFKYRYVIMEGLEETLATRSALRDAIVKDIEENGIAVITDTRK